jgi:hypothetical protein
MQNKDQLSLPQKLSRREFLKGLVLGTGVFASRGLPSFSLTQREKLGKENDLPQDLMEAVNKEYGAFERTVDWKSMIDSIASEADIVALGESHQDVRDMQTIGDLIDSLRGKRKIVVAVERFTKEANQALSDIHSSTNRVDIEAGLSALFHEKSYASVWAHQEANSQSAAGNPPGVSLEDQKAFEKLMLGCALAKIPIIGMDVTHEDRKKDQGMDDPSRNALWVDMVKTALSLNPEWENPLVIVIGGKRHMGRDQDSFSTQAQKKGLGKVISVGQRTFSSGSQGFTQIETLASKHRISDLILKNPERVGILNNSFSPGKGYWIAMHD